MTQMKERERKSSQRCGMEGKQEKKREQPMLFSFSFLFDL